jgi:ABC-type multidrug transport system permease subunit
LSATIAWDLIDEAQANFGIPGVIIAFFLMGWLYALLERWCRGLSVFSLRAMVALMVLALAVQVGITLGVYITALFQAMVALTTLAVVAMERRQLRDFVSGIRPIFRGSAGRMR